MSYKPKWPDAKPKRKCQHPPRLRITIEVDPTGLDAKGITQITQRAGAIAKRTVVSCRRQSITRWPTEEHSVNGAVVTVFYYQGAKTE